MDQTEIISIYKQHLQQKFNSDECNAMMMWVEDYFNEVTCQNTNNTVLKNKDLPQFDCFIPLERILNNEPVQYVFETAYFHKYRFKVNKATLIPRPETEELVEFILAENNREPLKGIDIGTGSGCIPITLLAERPNWKFKAIDLSVEALNIAQNNSRNLKVEDRLTFQEVDYLQNDYDFGHFDLIISNPPYIPITEAENMDKRVTDFEPHIALFTESDSLIFYKKILADVIKTGNSQTQVWLETHQDYCKLVEELFQPFGITKKIEDFSGNPRFIFFQKK